jgi:hypothetical protein
VTYDVFAYESTKADAWDEFCAGAVNATFLHTRRFLSYHGDRFKDLSLLLMNSGKIMGVFPAAESPTDPELVVSHPGATYGGVVHQGGLTGTRMIEAITALAKYYKDNYRRLIYKSIPYIYHNVPAQDDTYALFRYGSLRNRCDLSCAIDLATRTVASERRRRGLKKALKSVTLSSDPALLPEVWSVIACNLGSKHNVRPTHSLAELSILMKLFPDRITLQSALLEEHVIAGVVFFNSPKAWHAQYIGASEHGYEMAALDAVFDAAISTARETGARYFDFGISNENEGKTLNEGLYRFKSEFGGGGVAHEFWEMDLRK